ncbi:hypothetical protein GT043_38135 [Streptomyces sp. SID2131]|nr:hypothetical protein [Streptomyces sp. SID2131]
MCTYAFVHYKLHYACVSCRIGFKRHPNGAGHPCPRCSEPMLCAGHDFAAPRRIAAARTGVPLAEALGRVEPMEAR